MTITSRTTLTFPSDIVRVLGDSVQVELTPEDAKKLRDRLDELFPRIKLSDTPTLPWTCPKPCPQPFDQPAPWWVPQTPMYGPIVTCGGGAK